MEAVWRIEVADFPAFIVVDDKGNDFFADPAPEQPFRHLDPGTHRVLTPGNPRPLRPAIDGPLWPPSSGLMHRGAPAGSVCRCRPRHSASADTFTTRRPYE